MCAMRIVRFSEPFRFSNGVKKKWIKLEIIRTWRFVPGGPITKPMIRATYSSLKQAQKPSEEALSSFTKGGGNVSINRKLDIHCRVFFSLRSFSCRIRYARHPYSSANHVGWFRIDNSAGPRYLRLAFIRQNSTSSRDSRFFLSVTVFK